MTDSIFRGTGLSQTSLPAELEDRKNVAKVHYDVIILGDSLAARIAEVLLAKAGRRVLSVRLSSTDTPSPVWIPVSLHLERLLDLLDGRSCLVPASPFQVLSGQVRLTVHGITALLDELRREFPRDSEEVRSLLAEMAHLGERIEKVLWECGGLPLTGWASRWRFFYESCIHGLTRRRLHHPLAIRLRKSFSPPTAKILAVLFSGLALCPSEKLTVAEASLLWRSFGDNRGISTVALDALLSRLFEQFHGDRGHLNNLQPLPVANNRIGDLLLDDGRRCSATYWLFGSVAANRLLPASSAQSANDNASAAKTCQFGISSGAISPLLAPMVLLDGPPTMRLTMATDASSSHSRIICQSTVPAADGSCDCDFDRLAALFPFTTLQPDTSADVPGADIDSRGKLKAFPGAINPLLIGNNLLFCCGRQVLPSLGAIGEVMVAVTVVNHLQRQKTF